MVRWPTRTLKPKISLVLRLRPYLRNSHSALVTLKRCKSDVKYVDDSSTSSHVISMNDAILEMSSDKSLKASIWLKLTLFIVIVVVLSSGVLASVLWYKTREQLADEIARRLMAVSVLRKEGLDDYFMGEVDKIVLIASRIQIMNYLANYSNVTIETAEYDLHSAISAISEITSSAIYDEAGTLRFGTNTERYSEHIPTEEIQRMEGHSVQIGFPMFSGKIWEYNMSRVISLNERRVGVLVSWINATALAELIYDRTGLQETGELLVGVPWDQERFQLLLPARLDSSTTTVSNQGSMAAAAEQKSGIRKEHDYRGVDVIAAFTPVGYSNWGLVAKLDIHEAYAPIENVKLVIIVMIVVILILGIIASFCVAKVFTSPIIELGRVASALGHGDMRARVKIGSVWFRDEIYELQATFNSMAEQIANHHATLEQKVSERTHDLALANEVLATEIEERKRMEEELQNAKDAAVAADRAKSEFLANMSHEIRTPLNGIINCTELCLDTQTSLEQQEYLELVRFSAKHLLRIITDILDFSKIEAGKLEMENIQFSLYDQIEHAVSVLAARAHKNGLELAWKVHPDVPDQIIGDPGRLFQIFVNLIGNSIKFTDEGEVVVSVEVQKVENGQAHLLFYVKDTGVGIPKNKQDLLFQAFSQVDSSTTRLYGGTGLGLVISSKLAAAMGGRMWVESEGRGSTFFFTAAFRIHPICERPLAPGLDNLKGLTILVVDDNATSLGTLVSMLKVWGLVAEGATDVGTAKQALQKARNTGNPYKLIILDLWLKEKGASDLLHYLGTKQQLLDKCPGENRNLPTLQKGTLDVSETPDAYCLSNSGREVPSVVILTSVDYSDASRCKELGVEAHTTKPIKRALLLRSIYVALGVQNGEEALGQSVQQDKVIEDILDRKIKGFHILVAEDNVVNQRVAITLLRKWGNSTVLASNGIEAVEKYSKESFDLILMDVQMPVCDGFQATSKIRDFERRNGLAHTPILAMTAHAMSGDGDRCIASGMDGYISKPLNAAKLQELIQRITSKSLSTTSKSLSPCK